MKKITFSFLAFVTVSILSSFQFVIEPGIKINITNLRNSRGHVLVYLYKNGEGYPDKTDLAFKKIRLPVSGNSVSIMIPHLPAGNYAVSILHDENDDQKMNKNFFGIPKEGYGFSNNVVGTFGPPSFTKASFSFTSNNSVELTIRTRY